MKNIMLVMDNLIEITGYYPKDMPLDWYIDFYLNEFESLYINEAILKQLDMDSEALLEILEDIETDVSIIADSAFIEEVNPDYVTYYYLDTMQGVDSLELKQLDLSQLENIKNIRDYCQTTISSSQKVETILKITTPVDYKQVNQLQILLNLLY